MTQALNRPLKRGNSKEPLGGAIVLLLIYFFLEYFRPANPLKVPLAISLVLFIWWMTLKEKVWAPQVVCLYLLTGAIAVMGPFAVNNFSVWIGFQNMAAWLLCISIPMMCFANSLRKVRVLINALIALHCYLALHALLHNGRGPGGFVGDENDTALAINTMMPLAFGLLLCTQAARWKVLYLSAFVIMVAGVIATDSRGGFLGLVAVIVYCFLFSPRKLLGFAIGAVLLSVGLAFVPESYWAEMGTITGEAESDDGTGAHRLRLWGIAIDMFWANPIFGVGLDNFPANVGHYMPIELMEKLGRSYAGQVAHSVYFTILSETGAVGSLLVAAIVYFSVRSIRSVLLRTRKMEALTDLDAKTRANLLEIKGLAYGLGGAMVGYGATGIFLSAFNYPHFWYVAALIVALEQVTERMAVDSAVPQPALRDPPWGKRPLQT